MLYTLMKHRYILITYIQRIKYHSDFNSSRLN